MIRICSLGSGSKGNATVLGFDDTYLLVDCGFNLKQTVKRLTEKGIEPEQISMILVTHEHSDHIAGVTRFSNEFSIPTCLNRGTSLHKAFNELSHIRLFNSHNSFEFKGIKIEPIPVPHDSREANQFVFNYNGKRIGLLTDVGHVTRHMIGAYARCNALLLEFNYDEDMLVNGSYPYPLKKRVSGDLGHLSNKQSVEFINRIDCSNLELLVAMHKSEENNCQDIIEHHLNSLSIGKSFTKLIANQKKGFDWQEM